MDSSLILQLGIAVMVIVLIAASTVRFALRSSRTGAEPVIRANARKLREGWYQLSIAVANRAPYGVVVDELKRIRPRSARLMSPIQSVSTRKGDFQVWSDPATDKPKISIPLDLVIAAHEQHGGVAPRSEAHITAWLFLPDGGDPTELELELAVLDGGDHLRAYRFGVMREVGLASQRQARSTPRRS